MSHFCTADWVGKLVINSVVALVWHLVKVVSIDIVPRSEHLTDVSPTLVSCLKELVYFVLHIWFQFIVELFVKEVEKLVECQDTLEVE
jgi:hypothetical protein